MIKGEKQREIIIRKLFEALTLLSVLFVLVDEGVPLIIDMLTRELCYVSGVHPVKHLLDS